LALAGAAELLVLNRFVPRYRCHARCDSGSGPARFARV
jgi:hypothetical protein